MNIHLIRSEEVSVARFRMIVEILKQVPGPMKFIYSDEDIRDAEDNDQGIEADRPQDDGGKAASQVRRKWSEFFDRCKRFRSDGNINEKDLVVLFTDYGNERNWFSSWDDEGRRNFFIQTSGWEEFIDSEPCYPIAYELVTIPLYLSVCSNLEEVEAEAHKDFPRGCPFDYCENKADARLRLRTGDVCPECRQKMIEKKLDPAIARQIFAILDNIRSQVLFRNSFALTRQLSRLEVSTFHKEIRFADIGKLTISLTPREITIYLFFLKNPKGFYFQQIPEYRDEIYDIYRNFSHEAAIAEDTNTFRALINNEEHTLSQVISRIKKKISDTVRPDMAVHYIINNNNGRHSIAIDRSLVSYPDGISYVAGN
jgi:hypothetical protein